MEENGRASLQFFFTMAVYFMAAILPVRHPAMWQGVQRPLCLSSLIIVMLPVSSYVDI